MRRSLLALGLAVVVLAGCGKVSSDFHKAADDTRKELESFRKDAIDSQAEIERRRDQIKARLEVVTAATKSEREKSAQAVLVNTYVQISVLKEAEMLPPSEASEKEVARLNAHADQCLREYSALVGNGGKREDENGPCLKEAKAVDEK